MHSDPDTEVHLDSSDSLQYRSSWSNLPKHIGVLILPEAFRRSHSPPVAMDANTLSSQTKSTIIQGRARATARRTLLRRIQGLTRRQRSCVGRGMFRSTPRRVSSQSPRVLCLFLSLPWYMCNRAVSARHVSEGVRIATCENGIPIWGPRVGLLQVAGRLHFHFTNWPDWRIATRTRGSSILTSERRTHARVARLCARRAVSRLFPVFCCRVSRVLPSPTSPECGVHCGRRPGPSR